MKKGVMGGRLLVSLIIMLIVTGLYIGFSKKGISPAKTLTLAFERCYGQDYHDYELEITKNVLDGNDNEAYKYYKQFKTCQTEEKVFTDIGIAATDRDTPRTGPATSERQALRRRWRDGGDIETVPLRAGG